MPARPRLRETAIACLGAGAVLVGCGGAAGDERPIPDGPNVVIITTDDQSLHSFRRSVMPRTFHLVIDRGTRFRTALAAPPLCCPSRAGLITGQYPHNHGVFSNEPGYPKLRDPEAVLPVWMHEAGYTTGMFGKYLNGTIDELHGEAAPGWEDWFEVEDLSYTGATGYDDGDAVELGGAYTPRVLDQRAVDFIEFQGTQERPFLLWLSQTAPHFRKDPGGTCPGKSPQPLRRDLRAVRLLPFPRYPSFDERDVSDKPTEIAAEKPLSARARRREATYYRCTAGTLREVDRGVADIFAALKRIDAIDNTIVLFHSDNGLFFGEHRIRSQKGQVYEQALRVPMAMRIPHEVLGGRQDRSVGAVVSNQDVAPTLLALTGLDACDADGACRRMDGRSLVSLVRGKAPRWSRDRGVLVEQGSHGCKYAAIRTSRWLYNEILKPGKGGGCVQEEAELYDLRRDPDELENLILNSSPAKARIAELRARMLGRRLAALRECAGTTGPGACE